MTPESHEEGRVVEIKEMEEMRRQIMKLANRVDEKDIRTAPAPRPSILRVVDTVTTYGAYQEPL